MKNNTANPPRFLGYAASFFSILLFSSAAISIAITTEELRKLEVFRTLHRSLMIGSAGLIEHDLAENSMKKIVTPLPGTEPIIQIVREILPIFHLFDTKFFKVIYQSYKVLVSNQIPKALEQFSELDRTEIKVFLTQSNLPVGAKEFEILSMNMGLLKIAYHNHQEKLEQTKNLENVINTQEKRHEMLIKDLADLLGLPEQPQAVGDQSGFTTYQTGFLKGLPVMEKLPDGIVDLFDFKNKLSDAGGEINIYAPNPNQAIIQRLTDYKTTTATLIQEHSEMLSLIQEANTQLGEAQKKLITLREDSEKNLKTLLQIITDPGQFDALEILHDRIYPAQS